MGGWPGVASARVGNRQMDRERGWWGCLGERRLANQSVPHPGTGRGTSKTHLGMRQVTRCIHMPAPAAGLGHAARLCVRVLHFCDATGGVLSTQRDYRRSRLSISLRVAWLLRISPRMAEVTISLPGLRTPRQVMHECVASMMTATPLA